MGLGNRLSDDPILGKHIFPKMIFTSVETVDVVHLSLFILRDTLLAPVRGVGIFNTQVYFAGPILNLRILFRNPEIRREALRLSTSAIYGRQKSDLTQRNPTRCLILLKRFIKRREYQ